MKKLYNLDISLNNALLAGQPSLHQTRLGGRAKASGRNCLQIADSPRHPVANRPGNLDPDPVTAPPRFCGICLCSLSSHSMVGSHVAGHGLRSPHNA